MLLTDKCAIYLKSSTLGAKGETATWGAASYYWCRKISLSVDAIASYQQLHTQVTDKFIIEGTVTIGLGTHKIVYNSVTYEPQATARYFNNMTEVVVRKA